jgi:hypothetical protein
MASLSENSGHTLHKKKVRKKESLFLWEGETHEREMSVCFFVNIIKQNKVEWVL